LTEPPLLTVRGQAVVEVDPEIARVSLSIAARDPDRARAMRLLNDRATAVDQILTGFGSAIDKVETSGVRISPQFKSRKPQERITGYVAVVHHTITVADFDRLGELVAQLADQDLTEVAGPWWALRPDSPSYRRTRVEAVQDAVHRARDYAEAIGSQLVDLVELADTGLLSDGAGSTPGVEYMAASAGGPVGGVRQMAPEEFTFDISPTKQMVSAAVEARFRISPPDFATVGNG
jgi:uncharacterized protein YggE